VADHSYPVEVQSDVLEKITRAKPAQALSELIWNALDADATHVSVSLDYNDLESLAAIVVADEGRGIPRVDAPTFFRSLGGSWKKPGANTLTGRFLHGQEGRGRFKAFALGKFAEWAVVYERDDGLWSYSIKMTSNDMRHVNISDEKPAKKGSKPGVTLTIAEPLKDFRTFTAGAGLQELTEIFALYLADYENVSMTVDGRPISSNDAISSRKTFNLSDIVVDGKEYWTRLQVWNGVRRRTGRCTCATTSGSP
jgi:Histidine kinase-, DNA gyrase B-, and HSP90-like ATPase